MFNRCIRRHRLFLIVLAIIALLLSGVGSLSATDAHAFVGSPPNPFSPGGGSVFGSPGPDGPPICDPFGLSAHFSELPPPGDMTCNVGGSSGGGSTNEPLVNGAFDVVVGDSYISGEGAGNYQISSIPVNSDPSCDVSPNAWPTLLYQMVDSSTGQPINGFFENAACSGATINQISFQVSAEASRGAVSRTSPGDPIQGLGAGTAAVQVSAGINDSGLVNDLKCAGSVHLMGDRSSGCVPDPAGFQAVVNALVPGLVSLYKQIAADGSQGMAVEVTTYPQDFPQDGLSTCTNTGISHEDQQTLNQDFIVLDDGIRSAVDDARSEGVANIRVLNFDTALAQANMCSNPPGMNNLINAPNVRGIYHPNVLGHQVLAQTYQKLFSLSFPQDLHSSDTPPPDGTLIQDPVSGATYVVAGGSKFGFSDATELAASGYGNASISTVDLGEIEALPPDAPANGTLLRDADTGVVYRIGDGFAYATGSTAGAVTVPGRYIAASNGDAPAVGVDKAGDQLVFFNSGGQLEENFFSASTGKWSGTFPIGASLTGSPTVGIDKAGDQLVFFNSGGQLEEDFFSLSSGKWSGAFSIGATLTGSPTVGIDKAGDQLVFFNQDGQLEEDFFSISASKWSGAFSIGATLIGSPTVGIDASGDQLVFFNQGGQLTGEQQLEEDFFSASTGKWSGAFSIGATLINSPTVGIDASGDQLVFFNASGQLEEDFFSASAGKWSNAFSIGATLIGSPTARLDAAGDQMVFFNSGGQLEENFFSASTGKWSGAFSISAISGAVLS